MRQKIVVRVCMVNEKHRRKAFKIVACQAGIESLALRGQEIEVVGVEIDAAELTTLLRKKVGHAELLNVVQIEEKKDAGGGSSGGHKQPAGIKEQAPVQQPILGPCYTYPPYHYQQPYYYEYMDRNEPSCNIL